MEVSIAPCGVYAAEEEEEAEDEEDVEEEVRQMLVVVKLNLKLNVFMVGISGSVSWLDGSVRDAKEKS